MQEKTLDNFQSPFIVKHEQRSEKETSENEKSYKF